MEKINKIIIKDGLVIDPKNGIETVKDIYIDKQTIFAVQDPSQPLEDFNAEQIIDASEQIVCPGLVDLRNRLGNPTYEQQGKQKGTIASETYAAVSGGITSLCCPPDTNPVIDSTALVKQIEMTALQDGFCHVYPMAAMTKGLLGQELSEMETLMQAGCVGVSNAMQPISNTLVMRRVMEYAASHEISVFIHPQDYWLSLNGCAHEGQVSARLGLTGIPESAETIALLRDIELVKLTGVKAHFCQISTARGVEIIRQAKNLGLDISCDVTAHHLFLTEMDIGYFNSNCHVLPPLRTQRDQDALRAGLMDKTIDAIVSDHQPHNADAKLAPFAETEPGVSSVETFLALVLKLTEQTTISLPQVIAKISLEPATILGLDTGTIESGAIADICIFDPKKIWQVDHQKFYSQGKNTPFHGWELQGKVVKTLVAGKIVFEQN
ncbi:MAG: dihydroorotase [Pseudomonadota bacterium]